jgi:hypothetical protein
MILTTKEGGKTMNNKQQRRIKIYCCCCGKQAIWESPPRDDPYTTTLFGAKTGFKIDEVFCGYCSEEMDENGLFPEEQAEV